MAKSDITGKRKLRAQNVSHSNIKTKRWQNVNIQTRRVWVPEVGPLRDAQPDDARHPHDRQDRRHRVRQASRRRARLELLPRVSLQRGARYESLRLADRGEHFDFGSALVELHSWPELRGSCSARTGWSPALRPAWCPTVGSPRSRAARSFREAFVHRHVVRLHRSGKMQVTDGVFVAAERRERPARTGRARRSASGASWPACPRIGGRILPGTACLR